MFIKSCIILQDFAGNMLWIDHADRFMELLFDNVERHEQVRITAYNNSAFKSVAVRVMH